MSHNHSNNNPPPGYSAYMRPPARPPQISQTWSAPPLAPTPSVPQSVGKGFRPILQTQHITPPSPTTSRGPPIVASRSLPPSARNSPSPSQSDHGRYSEIPDQIQVSATLIRARKVDPFALKLDRQAMPPVVSWVGPSVISTLEPVKRGDTIIEIDGVKPKSQRDAKERIVKANGTSLRLLVRRDKTVLMLHPPPKSPLDVNNITPSSVCVEGRSAFETVTSATTVVTSTTTTTNSEPQRVRGEKAPRAEEREEIQVIDHSNSGAPEDRDDDLPRLRPVDQAVRRPPQESSSDWDSDDDREVAAAAARRAAQREEQFVDISRKGIAFGVDFLRKQRERAARRQNTMNIELNDAEPTPQLTTTSSTTPVKMVYTPITVLPPESAIPLSQASSSLFVEDVVTAPNNNISSTTTTTSTTALIRAEPIDVDDEEEEVVALEEVDPIDDHLNQDAELECENGDDGSDGPIIYDSAPSITPKGSTTPSYSPDRLPEEAVVVTSVPTPVIPSTTPATTSRKGILATPPRAAPSTTTIPPPPAYHLPHNSATSSHPHTPTNHTVVMFPPPPPILATTPTPTRTATPPPVVAETITPSQHTSATPTPPPVVLEVPHTITAPGQLYSEMMDMLHQPSSSTVDISNAENTSQCSYQHFMDVYDSKTIPQPPTAPVLDKYGRRVYSHCAPALRPPTPLPTPTYLQQVNMSKQTAQATSLYHFQLSCVAADLFTATNTPTVWRDQHFKGVGDVAGLEGRLPGSALAEKLKEDDELVESVVVGLQPHLQYNATQPMGGAAAPPSTTTASSVPMPPNPHLHHQQQVSGGPVGHPMALMGDGGHQYGKGKNQTKAERKLAKKEVKRAQREARNFFTGASDPQQQQQLRQQQRAPEDLQYFTNMFSNFFNPNQ